MFWYGDSRANMVKMNCNVLSKDDIAISSDVQTVKNSTLQLLTEVAD